MWRAKYKKNIPAQGKIKWKKIHARQLILKNIHAMAEKKKSSKEFDNEKKFLRLENSPPPAITFLKVRPLTEQVGPLVD